MPDYNLTSFIQSGITGLGLNSVPFYIGLSRAISAQEMSLCNCYLSFQPEDKQIIVN